MSAGSRCDTGVVCFINIVLLYILTGLSLKQQINFLIRCKLSCSDVHVAKEKLSRLFYQLSQLLHSIRTLKLSKSLFSRAI